MPGLERKSILLVEDELVLALAEAMTLRDYGFEVLTAASGEKAVAVIESGAAVDIVLMDINLGPGMDGTDAARIILAKRDIPLVFLSSHTEREVVEKTEEITNYGYVVKNTGETVLIASIKMAFKLHEAKRDLERHREALETVNEDLIRSQVHIMESERRFRTVADYTYDWEYWLAPDGSVLYISPSCERISGYSAGEFQRDPDLLNSMVFPDDREGLDRHRTRAHDPVEGSAPHMIDFRVIRRDGAVRWIAHVCQRIVTAKGEYLGIRASNRDITERTFAEAALRKSEAFSDSIIEHSPVPMWISDEHGTLIRINQACKDLLHITDGEVVGKYNLLRDNIVQEQGLLPLVQEVFNGGGTVKFAMSYDSSRLKHLALNEFADVFLEVTVSAVTDARGKTVNAIIQHADITASRKAEREMEAAFAALEKSEEMMRGIFRVAPTGIGIVKDRVLLDVNPLICEMTGYAREELIGASARVLYPTQEDFEYVGREKYRQINEKGTGAVETRWLRRDGAVIDVLLASTPMDLSDLSQGVIFTALDITARVRAEREREAALASLRENERLYRLIAENTGDCIWIMDMDLRFTYVSPSIVNVRGFTPEEAMLHTIDQVMPPHSAGKAMAVLAFELELEQSGAAQPGRIHRLLLEEYHKDGSLRWIDNTLTFLRDVQGCPLSILGVSRDITPVKRAEEEREAALAAMRAGEEKYRLLVENITEVIYTLDMEGIITYVSPVIERLSGYKADELVGRNFTEIIHPEDLPGLMVSYDKTVRGEIDPYEYRIFNSDGSEHYIRTSSRLILRDGRAVGITGVLTDITGRMQSELRVKEAAEALLASEKELRLITENMRDTVWLMDMELRPTWISPSVVRTRGYTLEDLAAMPLEKHLTPDSMSRVAALMAEHLAPEKLADPAHEIVISVEMEFIRKDGSTNWSDTIITLLRDREGRPEGLLAAGRDIGERKKMEKSLRESQELFSFLALNIADIIWILDLELRTTYVSPSIEKILGFSVEERKTLPLENVMTPDSLRRCWELLGAELARDGKVGVDPDRVITIEVEYYRRDGSGMWMENSMKPVRGERGEVTGICGVSHDISGRKRAADALREKEEALAKSLEEKSALLRELQHRVKNSLVMIAGLIGIESARSGDPGVRSLLANLRNRVDSVARMYSLLYQTGEVKRLGLDEYIGRIVQSLSETYIAQAGKISVVLDCVPVPVDVRRAAPFGLILNELVTNAIKYAFPDERSGTLWIRLAADAQGTVLVVEDDGAGPPPGFDPGFASGSGLHLVRMLVEQLDGTFSFERGERTVCTVRVPAVKER